MLDYPIVRDLIILAILGSAGVFGGYLSAVQKQVVNPNGSRSLSRVTALHMLQGAAGAIIIVTLSPVDPRIIVAPFAHAKPLAPAPSTDTSAFANENDQQLFIKLIALALIGGYAGGSLLESSASQYAKRITQIEERQKNLEEETKKGLDAIRLAEQILRGLKLSSSDTKEFKTAIEEASSSARFFFGQMRAADNIGN